MNIPIKYNSSYVRRERAVTESQSRPQSFSKITITLFLLFVAYTACPLIEVPGLDLSLSALILLFIAIEIFLTGDLSWISEYSGWIMLSGLFWLGILLSLIGNIVFNENVNIDLDNWKQVIRFAYWMLAFITTIYVFSAAELGPKVVTTLSLAILITSVIRWGEVLIFNKIGAWVGTLAMSQNDYGILFSTYAPFILVPLVSPTGRKWLSALGALVIWGAVVINGSRGSWISVSLGICVFMIFYAMAQPSRAYRLLPVLILPCLLGGLLLVAPESYLEKTEDRFETLQKLDQDKSFQIRQLMIQKGWRLFLESPIYGAGAGNFRKDMVQLELSNEMSYKSQAHFNRKPPHNSYISLLSETGLVGCLPFAFLLGILVIKGGRAAIFLARREEFWGIGIYVGFLMMSLHFWVKSGLTNTSTWVMYGLMAGMIVYEKNTSSENSIRISFRR